MLKYVHNVLKPLLAGYFAKRLLTITVILTFLLSSTALTNALVGTSYASQVQAQAPPLPSSSAQSPPPLTPICNPKSPALQLGSTGAKVTELQRALTQVGYGSLLGQGGIDGKFATSTQNAVKKFQQDNRLPVDGKVGPITWGALCGIIPNSFIVQLKSAGPGPLSPGSTREIVGMLTPQLAEVGGRVVAVYDQFGMFNVVFERPLANREQFINSLRTHPGVQGVFNDAIMTIDQLPPSQRTPTGIDRVDADLSAARSGDRRGDVNADIAVLDTGVSSHPDLNIYRCISFHLFTSLPNFCYDGNSHGTHVAGIAAAKDNNIGVVGTAPGARIWAIKVIPDSGKGDESDIIEGLNYVAANAKEIEVVNLSMGSFGFSFPYLAAIAGLVGKGVVVVVTAGNQNIDASSRTPANIPMAITVSAITDSDGKCGGTGMSLSAPGASIFQPSSSVSNPDDFFRSNSNFGSIVDLAAPGGNILSTDNKGSYTNMSGTSMAAPHVAGAAALYKSLHPTANPFQVDAFLKSVSTKMPATANPLVPCDGAGRGYFDDRYFRIGIVVLNDKDKEPLLYMGSIK
jgi:subtilisin family serine protease